MAGTTMPTVKGIVIGGDFNTITITRMFSAGRIFDFLTDAGYQSGFEQLALPQRVTHQGLTAFRTRPWHHICEEPDRFAAQRQSHQCIEFGAFNLLNMMNGPAVAGVHRLILIGDTGQLPPIGAGRPFMGARPIGTRHRSRL